MKAVHDLSLERRETVWSRAIRCIKLSPCKKFIDILPL